MRGGILRRRARRRQARRAVVRLYFGQGVRVRNFVAAYPTPLFQTTLIQLAACSENDLATARNPYDDRITFSFHR